MRITRLRLADLGRHRQLDLTLAPGITIVRGPNESGKTTIQRALELALARKVTSSQGDLDALRPWDGDGESRPAVSLEFEQEDLEATHRGTLEKSFRGSKGTVRLVIDDEVTTDPSRAEEQLAEVTGIPTEAFFRSTASIRHHEIDGLDRDESALRDRLQASISGGDRGTSAAKKKLERGLRDLQTKGERNPGRLKVAEEAVNRTQTLVDQGEAALALLERDRDSLAQTRAGRRQVEEAIAESRSMLEKARQSERLVADRQAATERYERYRDAVATSEEIDRLRDSHPSSQPLPIVRQVVERLRILDREIAGLRTNLGEAIDVDFELSIPEPVWVRWGALAIVMSVTAVAAVAIAVLTGHLSDPTIAVAVVALLVLDVGLSIFAIRKRRAAGDFRRSKQLREDQIARRLRGRSQLEGELREKEADFEAQLEGLGLTSLAGAEALLAAEEAHIQSIELLQARLEGFVGRQPPETLLALRDTAALEIEQKSAALDAIGPLAREPRARERLEAQVREHEASLERARDDEANARARVEANTVDAEQVAGETERLAAWREQLAALQRRARVYAATLAGIEQAEQATMRTATRYLEKKMVADLVRITDGRYRRVRVNDRTLDISIFAPEKNGWIEAGQLSQGTVDQVYLAARLGLVRLVTGDRRPPLIFDDPFITFDDERAHRALELMRDLAADFQIIYLTTSDRYDSAADLVVELPGPTARDDRAPDEPEEPEPAMEPETTGEPEATGEPKAPPATTAETPADGSADATDLRVDGAASADGAATADGGDVSAEAASAGIATATATVAAAPAAESRKRRADGAPGPT